MNDIIRRKMARTASAGGDGGPGADHGWRLAFARAARDTTGLLVEVLSMTVHRRSLAELLELPPERALLTLLDGPQGGLGLIAVSAEVLSALVEMQTTGRVSAAAPMPRRPTRTDAAMVSTTIDRALEELDAILADEADLVWAGGFRYASFLEDPRPLGLLLEDQPYRVLTAELGLSGDARTGRLIMALPSEGRGRRPAGQAAGLQGIAAAATGFTADLGQVVQAADCVLNGVLARLTLPLRDVMDLQPDQLLPLPQAALDRIAVEGFDGTPAGWARLGQQKGMRALRLSDGLATSARKGNDADQPALQWPEAGPDLPAPDNGGMIPFGGPLDLDGTGLLAAG